MKTLTVNRLKKAAVAGAACSVTALSTIGLAGAANAAPRQHDHADHAASRNHTPVASQRANRQYVAPRTDRHIDNRSSNWSRRVENRAPARVPAYRVPTYRSHTYRVPSYRVPAYQGRVYYGNSYPTYYGAPQISIYATVLGMAGDGLVDVVADNGERFTVRLYNDSYFYPNTRVMITGYVSGGLLIANSIGRF